MNKKVFLVFLIALTAVLADGTLNKKVCNTKKFVIFFIFKVNNKSRIRKKTFYLTYFIVLLSLKSTLSYV
jgi:hypothetical protein